MSLPPAPPPHPHPLSMLGDSSFHEPLHPSPPPGGGCLSTGLEMKAVEDRSAQEPEGQGRLGRDPEQERRSGFCSPWSSFRCQQV